MTEDGRRGARILSQDHSTRVEQVDDRGRRRRRPCAIGVQQFCEDLSGLRDEVTSGGAGGTPAGKLCDLLTHAPVQGIVSKLNNLSREIGGLAGHLDQTIPRIPEILELRYRGGVDPFCCITLLVVSVGSLPGG